MRSMMSAAETPEIEITEIAVGQGILANKGALVFIKFVGTLDDGTVFDSTEKHGRPFEFVVGSQKVIKGMSQAVIGMRVGGQRKVFIPSALAYGDRQIGQFIKPHSDLIFEIELLEARPRE